MKTKFSIMLCTLGLGLLFLIPGEVMARYGQADVYLKDPVLTPTVERVTLYDLDNSGYLQNPYLQLRVEQGAGYEPAYSATGQFIYQPAPWKYGDIIQEGVKFDAASVYYYITYARRYFQSHFSFQQTMNGSPDPVEVHLFSRFVADGAGLIMGGQADPKSNPSTIDITIPGSIPGTVFPNWVPYYHRQFSLPMHEYTHIVFGRYLQGRSFEIQADPANAINEALATFWPCTIMDEPRHSWVIAFPGMEKPDLSVFKIYDSTIQGDHGVSATDALASTLWAVRSHPRIGKTNAENLIWESMPLIPHKDAVLEDIPFDIIVAKSKLGSAVPANLHNNYIQGVFSKHGIDMKTPQGMLKASFLDVSNNLPDYMKPNETRQIYMAFQNQAPVAKTAPGLRSYNPSSINPNIDNPAVRVTHNWGVGGTITPSAVTVQPKDQFFYNFEITAPSVDGTYTSDWALWPVEPMFQPGYIVSKDIVVDGTSPNAPTNLVVTGMDATSVTLSWNASTDQGGKVSNYVVMRNGIQAGTPSETTFTDRGLTTGSTRYYNVKAVDAAGNISGVSRAVNALVMWKDLTGVTVAGRTITKTAADGWGNGGVATSMVITGNGYVEFTGGAGAPNKSFAVGLSTGNTDAKYTSMNYAIVLQPAMIKIYEGLESKSSMGRTNYTATDKFRIERNNGIVTYKMNGRTLWTSAVRSTGNLMVDTSIYTSGGTIENVTLSPAVVLK